MEQKTTLVKKILNIFLETISGFIVFIPVLLIAQNSRQLHNWMLDTRNSQQLFHISERAETMAYIIYCLALPYLCWLAGKSVWRSKNMAKGFAIAALLQLCGFIFLLIVFILGPVSA